MQRALGLRHLYVFVAALVALACLRLCFARVLWSDEDYHMAAALEILRGKLPYRDFWYDKPPLSAFYYLAMGAIPGVFLRLWDAGYILLCCFLAHRLAKSWWGEAEGRIAALLLAFFTTFYLPAAVIPFAPDMLLLAPHLGAVYLARQGRAMAAGVVCAVGFWINVKALFVAAACAFWTLPVLFSFATAVGCGALVLWVIGAWSGYWQQVWIWGLAYAPGAAIDHPLALAAGRVANWAGFHAALVLSALKGFWSEGQREQVKIGIRLGMSFAAVCLGNHFAPRYFLQLVPPLVVISARGIVLTSRKPLMAASLVLLLLIPLVRFGPLYGLMTTHMASRDVSLDLDSQQVATRVGMQARAGDTLFVWGYRPDVYVYTRLPFAGFYWDSQPLTGVAADRHLTASKPLVTDQTVARLEAVERSRPTFFVDGLGRLNDNLKPQNFAQMRALLQNYDEVGRTALSVIYRRKD
jgi:hypothetical protein